MAMAMNAAWLVTKFGLPIALTSSVALTIAWFILKNLRAAMIIAACIAAAVGTFTVYDTLRSYSNNAMPEQTNTVEEITQ
jgi:hypothetical protein